MNDMTPPMGHNSPPDPLDEALAPYGDYITEAESWLDGDPVTTEDQMKAVDALTKQIKKAKKAATDAQGSESKPLHDAWKAAFDRYKPTIADLDRMAKGLVSVVSDYKKKLAAEKAEKERREWEAANKARLEAEAKAAQAKAGDIEAQREAAEAKQAAIDAEKQAKAVAKDTVKSMRTITKYEIRDHKMALHDIAANDRDAMTAFIEEYVRKNFKARAIAGVHVWKEKEAF